jgi:hypothetical protein
MVKKVYTDDNTELEAYVNEDNLCYIQVCDPGENEWFYTQSIVLDASDLEELIQQLNDILEEIK